MKTFCTALILYLVSLPTYSQQPTYRAARPGAKGIFVIAGDEIAGGKRSAYRIERRTRGEAGFKQVALLEAVTMPETFRINMARTGQWLPYPPDLTVFKTDSIWRKVRAAGRVSVLKNIGFSIPVMAGFNLLWLDTEVTPGQVYQYRISGVGDNYSLLSEEVKYAPEPVAPAHLQGHFYDSIRKTLSLSAYAAGEHKPVWVEAWRSEEKEKFTNIRADVTFRSVKDSLKFTLYDTTAAPHRLYRYFIRGYDAYGNTGPVTDTLSVASLDPVQVPLPDRVSLQPDSLKGSITLAWTLAHAPLIKMLRLYRSTNSVNGFETVAELSPTQTRFTDEGLQPATPYFYYFEVEYKTLNQPGRSITYSTAYKSGRLLFPPLEVTATGNKEGISLSWQNRENEVKGFHLYRAETGGPFELISGLIPVRDTTLVYSFHDTAPALNGGKFYHYTLKAVSTSFVEGRFSDTVSARPLKNIPVPKPPMEVDLNTTDGKTWITWDDVSAYDAYVTGYRLLRSRRPAGKNQYSTDTLFCANNFYADSLLLEGETYRYTVVSLSYLGMQSAPSAPVFTTLRGRIPSSPASLMANPTPKGVKLTWETPAAGQELQYTVYRYERGQKPVKLATLAGDKDTYTDAKALKGRHYFYYLRSVSSKAAESDKSNEAGVRTINN